MAREMKAVIRAEMDPSGVVKGVARAQAELRKLNAAAASTAVNTGVTAAITAAQIAARIGSQVVNAASNRVQGLTQIATSYNLQAANASTQAQVAEFARNKRLAAALGPDVARGFAEQTRIKDADAMRVINDPLMGPGLANSMALGANKDALVNTGLDQAIGTAGLSDNVAAIRKMLDELRQSFRMPF